MKVTLYYVHAWIEVLAKLPQKGDFSKDPSIDGLMEISTRQLRAYRKALAGLHHTVEGKASSTSARVSMDKRFVTHCLAKVRKHKDLASDAKHTWSLRHGPSMPTENGWKTGRVGEPTYLHPCGDKKGGRKNHYFYAKRSANKFEVLVSTITRIELNISVSGE